ncbi:AMP-binding protein [Kitasatospora sp. GP82]|uniref:AMP-binding protein n=1 Tax=Kitasatospora sp. GP82 TaxID=3035089 RepID=UPI0024771257|nr:AMP-binding protein [Kitasatospora sp. GP82]MDH6124054.1 fatty-acyl-CoA synthase [Kitasatospora sp. GP82]
MTEQTTGHETYAEGLLDSLAAAGTRDVLHHGPRRISGAKAHNTVIRLANALLSAGVRKGDGVAVLATNSPEAVLLSIAVHLAGCRLVFVRTDRGLGEQAAFIEQAQVTTLVWAPALGERASRLAGDLGIPLAFSLGPSATGRDLLESAVAGPTTFQGERAAQQDVVTLLYTGGTTGRPKLVAQRHPYYQGLVAGSARQLLADSDAPRLLLPMSVTHTSGHLGAMAGLMAGGTVVLMDSFDAKAAIEALRHERITGLLLTPPMLYEILDHPDCPADGFPALKRLFYTGAAAAPARLRQAIERFGPVLHQIYGTSEAPGITALLPAEHDLGKPHWLRSCGRPGPGLDVELRNADGTVTPGGEVGELHVRGGVVMSEYWGDPEGTRQALRDGWLGTGDLAYQDREGYLYLVDRAKDVIVTGRTSSNVYSRLLDDFLVTLPGVAEAAAVGVPDDLYGEAVHVFLVANGEAPIDRDTVRARVAEELGELYRPRDISVLDALPWTTVGKIDKKALRALVVPAPGPAPV